MSETMKEEPVGLPGPVDHSGGVREPHRPGWRGVRSRKFGGDAVLHEGGWYHCQCYPCPNLTKWCSIYWNSNVCPSCMVKKRRAAIAKVVQP